MGRAEELREGGRRRDGKFTRPHLPVERKHDGRSRGEPLLERLATGARRRALDQYS